MRTIVTHNTQTAVKVICINDYLDIYERMGLNGVVRNETQYIKDEIYLANYNGDDLYIFVEDSNHSWTQFDKKYFMLLDDYIQDKIKDVLS